jgi:hypothetical protein
MNACCCWTTLKHLKNSEHGALNSPPGELDRQSTDGTKASVTLVILCGDAVSVSPLFHVFLGD